MSNHPITPPPELLDQWCMDATLGSWRDIATQAAQWGADQELEACVKWIEDCGISSVFTYDEDAGNYIYHPSVSEDFRAARRPKPPSLKEQAIAVIENAAICDHLSPQHEAILRRALEQLDD